MTPSPVIEKSVVGDMVYVTWLFGDVLSPSVAVTLPICLIPLIPEI